jgi:hypothetical protein
LPGEEIRFAVHQPALRLPGIRIRRYAGPNRAILLTERHLIIIEDASPGGSYVGTHKYRINRYFHPRSMVMQAEPETHAQLDWLCLTIGTPAINQEIRLPLSDTHCHDLLRELNGWFIPSGTR